MKGGRVTAVCRDGSHRMRKPTVEVIQLRAEHGVEGDSHAGATVQHRSRVAKDPTQPNLRQVHLMPAERLDALREQGFELAPGQMGENVTTRGLDLLALPTGTRLRLGDTAVVEVTGLRNPCGQLNGIQEGLMAANLEKAPGGELIRKAGVMAIVLEDGAVRVGDVI
ncbi:MAG: MOSC domain-containing protein, partial [Myxococcota bacterium]